MKQSAVLFLLFLGLSSEMFGQRIVLPRSERLESESQQNSDEDFEMRYSISTSYSEWFAGVAPLYFSIDFTENFTSEVGIGMTYKHIFATTLGTFFESDFNQIEQRDYTPGLALYLRNKFYGPEMEFAWIDGNRMIFQVGGSMKNWNYTEIRKGDQEPNREVTAFWNSATFSLGWRRDYDTGIYFESLYGLSYTRINRSTTIDALSTIVDRENYWLPSMNLTIGFYLD